MSEVDGSRASLGRAGWLMWRPSAGWAAGGAVMLAWAILHLSKVSEFIYYQF